MPAARQRIRQDVGEIESVDLLAFHLVVRGGRAKQDLGEEQREHEPEIFRGRLHRRRDRDAAQRIGLRRCRAAFLVAIHRVVPAEQADTGDHEQHAEYRPQERARRREVADQRIVRPVVGVRDGVSRTIGRARPRAPEEERGELPPMFRRIDRGVLHGIGFAQRRSGGFVAEQTLVVRCDLRDRRSLFDRYRQHPRRCVVAVVADVGLELGLQLGLVACRKFAVRLAVRTLRAQVEPRDGFAMQEIRAPVRSDQCAVAPDRSELLPADALPDRTARVDVGLRVQHRAVRTDHRYRHRRLLSMDLPTHPQQHRERADQQCSQPPPKLPCLTHDATPIEGWASCWGNWRVDALIHIKWVRRGGQGVAPAMGVMRHG